MQEAGFLTGPDNLTSTEPRAGRLGQGSRLAGLLGRVRIGDRRRHSDLSQGFRLLALAGDGRGDFFGAVRIVALSSNTQGS